MEEYIKWKDANNLQFDSWLRVHVRAGGKIVKVCSKAMLIPGTLAQGDSVPDQVGNLPEKQFF